MAFPDRGAGAAPAQVHLSFGSDPASAVTVSWCTAAAMTNPRVVLAGGPTAPVRVTERGYTDGISGERVFCYHAPAVGLSADTLYRYAIVGEDGPAPFVANFHTAASGAHPFRFTSFGDLATPDERFVLSSPGATAAVDEVERQAPLFHLMNGDLCYANLNPSAQPAVWRAFGDNVERSAAFRPWMPCPGNHEVEFGNGPQGLDAYLARHALPDNGVAGFRGHWYAFRVGHVLFVSLNANDVIHQDCCAFVPGPEPIVPTTGAAPIAAGTARYHRGYSGGRQSAWLESTLAEGRANPEVEWIIVQLHQCALSSSPDGNGSDLGIREAWLPAFDRFGVDLVIAGHDHTYERTLPVRGVLSPRGWDARSGAPLDTMTPAPVTFVDRGRVDTSAGTVHLVLGAGGASSLLTAADVRGPAKVFTRRNPPEPGADPGSYIRSGADGREDAVWSARCAPARHHGIGIFDVQPGVPGGEHAIRFTYRQRAAAFGADGGDDSVVFECVTFTRPALRRRVLSRPSHHRAHLSGCAPSHP